ncbi:MAG: hypothetical protein ACP5O2_09660 [Bacteroidales bacterium]
MNKLRSRILAYLKTYPYGQAATAYFLLCAVSGMVLAVPYDVHNAWASVSRMMVFNPWAAFFRNFHYWTAQLFLLFTLFHLIDHGLRQTFGRVKPGVWLRLVLGLLFVFYVMLSGFMLKGDPDSLQAVHILGSILSSIPLAGLWLKQFFLGHPGDLQLIYVHHVATATLAVFLIIIEHSRMLWTSIRPALHALLLALLLSVLLMAPLHDGISEVSKGPWYFLGLQEILHYLSNPLPAIISFLLLLLLFYGLRFARPRLYKGMGISLLIAGLAYGVFTFIGLFFRGAGWELTYPWNYSTERHIVFHSLAPLWNSKADTLLSPDSAFVLGRYEGCLTCHGSMAGFSPSHNPKAIGCASCHLGNPFTLDEEAAHREMILVPGNLATARLTCGSANCHADLTQRIHTSLMTTLSGMVSVDRWAFGELPAPHGLYHIKDVKNSPADMHLRNLCAGCHLGQPKEVPGVPHYLEKGGGCNACHLMYSDSTAQWVHAYYREGKKDRLPTLHPRLSINISDDKCATCHNRSGRITESYAGWYETLLPREKLQPGQEFRIIEGKRVFLKAPADVHHQAGLACIDCHDALETMGDGNLYAHKEDAVKIACSDCHRKDLKATLQEADLDVEARKILALREYLQKGKAFASNEKAGRPLLNVQAMPGGEIKLISRLDGKLHNLRAPAPECTAPVHASLSCQACHSAWAPTCLGCHNSWAPDAKGWDFKYRREIRGTWQEAAGVFEARQPSLGIREVNGKREVVPFVPGMVMTIDFKGTADNNPTAFHRLFAPLDPHTTARRGLHCKACHNSSIALGLGAGTLAYQVVNGSGHWTFDSEFAPMSEDGLPPDAWTAFLKNAGTSSSTRMQHRPFTPDEQKKILQVGACLHCHGENPSFSQRLLYQYDKMLRQRSPRCVLPY